MAVSEGSALPLESHLWVTILAGGVGSRFWPLSTPSRPKQLLPLGTGAPLIADAVDRAKALVPKSRIRILTGERLERAIREALPELPPDALMVEAARRGTGPVLAWAARLLSRRDPEAVLVSLHSDHVVEPVDRFRDRILAAAAVAERHRLLVTIGITPTRPERGYVRPGEGIGTTTPARAFRVARFHEKPDAATARGYVEAGYLWNSGIFVWPARLLIREVERHAPEIASLFPHLEAGAERRFFEESPTISVDEAVLERSDRVAVVPADFDWDDVGSWEALRRTRAADEAGNVRVGEAHIVDGRDNIAFSGGAPVVLFGVEDLVVVQTEGATLVTRRSRAAELKELLKRLPDRLRQPGG